MARIRSIKPEFWTSEQVMECSMNARLLFIGMWNFADDLGRLSLAPKTIKAQVFPGDEITSETILGMIEELSLNGLLIAYEVDGKQFLQITGWQHQRIDKPQPGKCPAPVNGYSKNVRGMVATDRKGEEGNGKDNSEANASGADAPVDPRTRLFKDGLASLSRLTGKGPDACRSFVGKCLKAASDDAVTVLGLIEDAERNQVADASAWIVARLPKQNDATAKPLTPFQKQQSETKDVLAKLGAIANGHGSGQAFDRVLSVDPGGQPGSLRGGTGSDVRLLPRTFGSGGNRSG